MKKNSRLLFKTKKVANSLKKTLKNTEKVQIIHYYQCLFMALVSNVSRRVACEDNICIEKQTKLYLLNQLYF